MKLLSFLKNKRQDSSDMEIFKKYITDEVLSEIKSNSGMEQPDFRETELDFCLIKFHGDATEFREFLYTISSFDKKYNLLIENFFPPYLSIYFTVPSRPADCSRQRIEFAGEMSGIFSGKVSLIHGKSPCVDGNFRTGEYFSYRIVLSNFIEITDRLNSLEAGSVEEYK